MTFFFVIYESGFGTISSICKYLVKQDLGMGMMGMYAVSY